MMESGGIYDRPKEGATAMFCQLTHLLSPEQSVTETVHQ
jgi:hypothetical protein